ncbi:thiamine diphosphokinase [Clostridiaceae bacterium M8S5]|nr:thiamine diphosphokinase [Clostridiaceae bacterium M8S5]
MNVAIFGSGRTLKENIVKKITKDADLIICADGGVKHLFKYGIFPDVVVGDLDSIKIENLNILKQREIEIVKFPTDKDYTDMEIALEYAIKSGAKEIHIGGATGSRMDHSLGNVLLLSSVHDKGIKATIYDNSNEITILKEESGVFDNTHKYISILPVTQDGAIVSTDGMKYEVNQKRYKFASLFGVSNEILKESAKITIHKGVCIVIKADD